MSRKCCIGLVVFMVLGGCASGRVRGAQGTEMGQAEEYEPESKVEAPVGNVLRTSGPMIQPEPYPLLEVDLERQGKRPPGESAPEPEAEPDAQPRRGEETD